MLDRRESIHVYRGYPRPPGAARLSRLAPFETLLLNSVVLWIGCLVIGRIPGRISFEPLPGIPADGVFVEPSAEMRPVGVRTASQVDYTALSDRAAPRSKRLVAQQVAFECASQHACCPVTSSFNWILV